MQTPIVQPGIESHIQQRIILVPTKNPEVFNIQLHLPFKTVYPGMLDLAGEGYFRMKRKSEYIHRKMNAWGVCAEIVERYEFKWVSILCDGNEFITTKAFLTKFGNRFAHRNYEAQYFLELSLWGIDAVRDFEKSEAQKPQQLSIFNAA